jgi:hypothetical protein
MELSNEQLAQELRRLRIEHSYKEQMRHNILATDPEIKDIKKKIESSYVSKERAKQLAEKQVRTL